VECESCHGDVTRGTGDVPKARCGSCHNQQAHLERFGEVEFMHRMHVTEHSVSCLECHTEVEHGLPARETHYQGECSDCHTDTHGATSSLYRGVGGLGVDDDPSIMFLARVTCTGCHRPPFPGAPVPQAGATWKADPIACLDCHGPGYEGMQAAWQQETRAHVERVRPLVESLHEALGREGPKADETAARAAYARAAHNLGLVLLDRSDGVHNLPYARSLLQQAADDARAGHEALVTGSAPAAVRVEPSPPSELQCTTLCHAGILDRPPTDAFGRYAFPHGPHLKTAGLDCSTCHEPEPHGTTVIPPADCAECHHPDAEEPEQCTACHRDVGALKEREPESMDADPMADIDCVTCHESIGDGHELGAVLAMCADCHEDEVEDGGVAAFYEAWRKAAEAPLAEVEAALQGADPTTAIPVRRELEALRRAGAFHNPPVVREAAKRLLDRLR